MQAPQILCIGNTPLCKWKHSKIPNNNQFWIKEEWKNPFGSHYDRVYKSLFQHYEEQGKITPGCRVLETTSGSAGVSFAGIGKLLGYQCIVALPAGGEKAREDAIRQQGAELILTNATSFVSGFPEFVLQFLAKNRDVVFMNHSMGRKGTENKVTLAALGEIAIELQRDLGSIDVLIVAIGNGSSILGPARILAQHTTIVTFESFQSGVGYEMLYPGRYRQIYGIDPGELPRHQLPGTSYKGIAFPHIQIAFQKEHLVGSAYLVSDVRTDAQYKEKTGRELPQELPRWDDIDAHPYGRTTRAGLSVALKVAESIEGKNIVVLGYDHESRYDS